MSNPNIPQLLQSTANMCAPAGCESAPPVPVGLVLRLTPNGAPVPYPFAVPAGGVSYLTVALDVDFRATDLILAGDLSKLYITSWTSNGIRDQNLLAETGIPGKAFDITSLRRFGFDTAPTAARQQIVIEVANTIDPAAGAGDFSIIVGGLVSGVCGDCNTTRRGQ